MKIFAQRVLKPGGPAIIFPKSGRIISRRHFDYKITYHYISRSSVVSYYVSLFISVEKFSWNYSFLKKHVKQVYEGEKIINLRR